MYIRILDILLFHSIDIRADHQFGVVNMPNDPIHDGTSVEMMGSIIYSILRQNAFVAGSVVWFYSASTHKNPVHI